MNTIQKFKHIRTFIFDMDGVLTDGKLYINGMEGGEPVRSSDMKDGYAISLASQKGYKLIIISGSESESYRRRLSRLGVQHIYMTVADKAAWLSRVAGELSCDLSSSLYMGDDMPDIPAMNMCYLKTCPADACDDVKMNAEYISPFNGGKGCVRDVIEKVLKINGHWE